ncbi:hypothetical protein AHAS_Ahas16G0027800 [Arachis hypogaea]
MHTQCSISEKKQKGVDDNVYLKKLSGKTATWINRHGRDQYHQSEEMKQPHQQQSNTKKSSRLELSTPSSQSTWPLPLPLPWFFEVLSLLWLLFKEGVLEDNPFKRRISEKDKGV